ncbi:MAG: LysR substrate-binding domain-containing protein [Pseudomonadota bacterium]|nr:LysR substrate-binding domain-containing protein [Pseudomonadota bacterium]
MALTPHACVLVEPVNDLCRGIESIWRAAVFDPRAAERNFVISSADYGPLLLVPAVAPLLREKAPGISLTFTDGASESAMDDSQNVDFRMAPRAVLQAYADAGDSLLSLFHDEFVAVVSSSHRLAQMIAPTREDIDAEPHVVFSMRESRTSLRAVAGLLSGGPAAKTIAVVQHFSALPLLAMSADAVTIVPRRLLAIFQQFLPLHVLEEGVPRARVEMCLGWNRRFDADPAHRWFRELVIEAIGDEISYR